MKNVYEVLLTKLQEVSAMKKQIEAVQKQVDALRIVAPLLDDIAPAPVKAEPATL